MTGYSFTASSNSLTIPINAEWAARLGETAVALRNPATNIEVFATVLYTVFGIGSRFGVRPV